MYDLMRWWLGLETEKSLGRLYQMLSKNKTAEFCSYPPASTTVSSGVVEYFSWSEESSFRTCYGIYWKSGNTRFFSFEFEPSIILLNIFSDCTFQSLQWTFWMESPNFKPKQKRKNHLKMTTVKIKMRWVWFFKIRHIFDYLIASLFRVLRNLWNQLFRVKVSHRLLESREFLSCMSIINRVLSRAEIMLYFSDYLLLLNQQWFRHNIKLLNKAQNWKKSNWWIT